jgi:hypothetical protein
MNRNRGLFGPALAVVAMTIFVTWPQALHMSGQYAWHQDPEFSIWRLGWIAHALAHDPRHLFAANIFYPSPNPLTYSDAILLEGVLAAPLFWIGLPPILIYNIMLLGGIAGSGLAVYVLARELTRSTTASLFAAAIFTMAPYRIEHFMHLEMQWSMWIPLTFWALHLTLTRDGGIRYGVLAGLFMWLQIASCVYYGVFLAIAVAAYLAVEAVMNWRRVIAAVPALAAGAVAAAVLTAPYLWVYVATARNMGPRDMSEIAVYSGRYWSYFSAPKQNWLRGWSASLPEVNLFLGWNAMALALAGVFLYRERRQRAVYAAIAAVAITLSLGLNTPFYGWLIRIVPTLQGLRSPSRFSIIACCAVGILAAFGVRAIEERLSASPSRQARMVLPVLFLFLLAEYANTGLSLVDRSNDQAGTIYRVMDAAGPGALVELPMPVANALPGMDTLYELWSLGHWHPLINGYSGYFPPQYIETITRMETFPDDESVARLQRLQTRYLIVHCAFYTVEQGVDGPRTGCPPAMLIGIGARKEFRAYGTFTDPLGRPAYLFGLTP